MSTAFPQLRLADLCGPDEAFHVAELRHHGTPSLAHRHDFLEVFWVTRGTGTEVVRGAGRIERHPLATGDYALVAAKDTHHFESSAGLSFVNVAFPRAGWSRLARRYPEVDGERFSAPAPRRRGRLTADAAAALDTVAAALRDAGRTALMLDLFLLTLHAAVTARAAGPAPAPPWLRAAVGSEQALQGGVGGLIAACGGYSRAYVARACRRAYGLTPTDLVRAQRLREAARLLERTDDSVLDVGLASGFANAGHFHQCFKARFGLTPRRYRARSRAVAPARPAP